MTDCVIVQPVARCGIDLLKRAGLVVFEAPKPDLETLRPHLKSARAAITRDLGLSSAAIEAAPNLKIIVSHGTGTDKIDTETAMARGIRVVNTPGTNAQSVAEHALALILACARQIPAANNAIRDGNWSFRNEAHPVEIAGKQIGLIGYGHVARRLAAIANGLGMTVQVHSSHVSDAELANSGIRRASDLDTLLSTSDIVSLHGLPDASRVLDAARLLNLQRHAILINTARGALIDEAALVDALRNRRLFAAGLDVFAEEPLAASSPLLDCPNLILTPHMGGSAKEALERTAREVARKVIEGLGLSVPD